MPINAGSLAAAPRMELTFRVQIASFVSVPATGKNMGPTQQWTLSPRIFMCDIAPLKDEIYFNQSGTVSLATQVFHFFANTPINPKNRILVLSSKRLAGPIGSWFEISEMLAPTETIAFVRCYGIQTDAPPL